MTILHVCNGWETTNGAANIARFVAAEQTLSGHEVRLCRYASPRELRAADEVWIHCGWMPCLWWAALWAKRAIWVPEACYDPVRLAYHGWKKRLVGPIERFCLRRTVRVVATCEAERGWIAAYEPHVAIGILDVRRFFKLEEIDERGPLHVPCRVLYLGRRHPLKGVAYLERAVEGMDVALRIVSDHSGVELEKDWNWCDVLCLPTLSENFGLVVAEALKRGKRVIVTDGAPAWEPPEANAERWWDGVCYLKGFRDGTDETRVELLKGAILGLQRQ
ncbi:MAG: hypothetical protein MJ138_07085 [Kiritimatiellae bacterium]|nr:hypothetical protein [Kiritimatiellia bacterium]